MDILDPFIRTPSSPVALTTAPPEEEPSALLRTARWHAGLTQAEVAQRARTSQPAVWRYEKGVAVPSLDMLRRLLAACGMRLELATCPEPGLIDAPTRDLLGRPPLERLPEEFQLAVEEIVRALHGADAPALLADRAAARVRGAVLRVVDLEFWLDEAVTDVKVLEATMSSLGVDLWPTRTRPALAPEIRPRLVLLEGGFRRRDLRIRGMRSLADHLDRATPLQASFGTFAVTSAADTVLFWHTRDRDRLALQRAEILRRELVGPAPL